MNAQVHPTVPPFRSSQASQLFISCCFALSLTGVFWLIAAALDTGPPPTSKAAFEVKHVDLWFVPLALYLIFIVWRQYASYYIPVQYYRDRGEGEMEELTTFFITIVLAAYPVVCVYFRIYSPLLLLFLIGLNLAKIDQMKRLLPESQELKYAHATLDEFRRRLWFYAAALLILVYLPVLSYLDLISRSDWSLRIAIGVVPLAMFFLTAFARTIFFPPEHPLDAWKFFVTIHKAMNSKTQADLSQ